MTAYYNEFDPFAAAWLRELIKAGHIAPGEVDERSIIDVHPDDLKGFTQCHFFAGIGVWSYALRRAGWPDDRPVWTGSCPCQPFSAAGKGDGFADERHLWPAWYHLITQRRPSVVFGEQVASKAGLGWLDLVYADMQGADYAIAAVDLPSSAVGAPHIRQRLFFVAEHASMELGNRSEAPQNAIEDVYEMWCNEEFNRVLRGKEVQRRKAEQLQSVRLPPPPEPRTRDHSGTDGASETIEIETSKNRRGILAAISTHPPGRRFDTTCEIASETQRSPIRSGFVYRNDYPEIATRDVRALGDQVN